ncbi:MAG: type II toxin-antitoxin system RelE/ParE family toxin [Armatimonadota bacterium]|nr:type II toxin-antitoxin system RelE/ParE family toxin [Armatimonadota bacterium]
MVIVEVHPDCLSEDLGKVHDEEVLEGILDKIALLEREPDFGRPLRGPLRGHHRITYGRYRIVYRWDRARDHVLVWYVGVRRENLYELIEKALQRRGIGGVRRSRP